MQIAIGISGRAEATVTEANTAAAAGSGLVPVFGTPYMIALMENAAVNALAPYMAPGEGSVGTRLEVSHDAATPVGMKVWAQAEVTAVEGRRITFSVSAFDEAGPIGAGIHQRFVIDVARFLDKSQRRKEAQGNVH